MRAQILRDAADSLRNLIGTPDDESDGWIIPGPWHVSGRGEGPFAVVPAADEDYDTIARTEYGNEAVYMATMHPGVGLVLADWLDVEAYHIESHDCEAHCEPDGCERGEKALTLARAILGGAS